MNSTASSATLEITSTALDSTTSRPIVRSGSQITLGAVVAAIYLFAIGGDHGQVAFAAIAVGAGAALVWPLAGLAMVAIIMPMHEPEILSPFRVNGILIGATMMGCVLRLPTERPPLKVHPGLVLLLGYVLISALSIPPLLSGHPSDWTSTAANELLHVATGVGLFMSAIYLFRGTPPDYILGLAIVGATIAALLSISESIGSLPIRNAVGGLLVTTTEVRASGGFSDANYLGLFMSTAAVFALGVLAVARRPWKLVLIPVVIFLCVAVALTFSRGSYLGTFAGIVVLIGMRNRAAGAAAAITLAVLAVALYPIFLEARLGEALDARNSFGLLRGQAGRTEVAAAAAAMFATAPIFGVGFGVFQFVSPAYTGGAADATFSHNQYLSILAEQGLTGTLIFIATIALLVIALRRSRSSTRSVGMAVLACYLVVSVFIDSATSFQGSSLVWLALAAALIPDPVRTARGDKE